MKPFDKLIESEINTVAERLKVMGHPLRLRILKSISEEPKTGVELAEDLSESQPNIVRHLLLMKRCGLLKTQRDRHNVFYSLADPEFSEILNYLPIHE